jgi:hypothetical protein
MKQTCCCLFVFAVCLAYGNQVSAEDNGCKEQANRNAAKKAADEAKGVKQDAAIHFLELSRSFCPLDEPVYRLANLYEKLGRWASAWKAYEQIKGTHQATKIRQKAEKKAGDLAALVPHVRVVAPSTVVFSGESFKVLLELDHESFEPGTRNAIDPGPHIIQYSTRNKLPGSKPISMAKGDDQVISISEADIRNLQDHPSLFVKTEVKGLEIRLDNQLAATNTTVYLDANKTYELQFSVPCKQPGIRHVPVNGRTVETISDTDTIALADMSCCPTCPKLPGEVLVRFVVTEQVAGYQLLFRGKPVAPPKSTRIASGPFDVVASAPGFKPEVITGTIPDDDSKEHAIAIPSLSPLIAAERVSPILRWTPVVLFGLATTGAAIWHIGEKSAEDDAMDRVKANQSDPVRYPIAASNLRDAHARRVRSGWVLVGSATLFTGSLIVALLTGSPPTVNEKTAVSMAFMPNGMTVSLRTPLF